MSDAISREGTSCWLEAMGYPKLVDKDVEIIAWMPLPEEYRGG